MKINRECDSYGWQKLHQATRSLMMEGSQRERLHNAVFHLINVKPEANLPVEIRDDFKELIESLQDINKLDDVDIDKAASKILSLYNTTARYQGPFDV